jgi:16S rRNA processing protein RimM
VHVAAFTEPRDNILQYRPLLISARAALETGRNGSDEWRTADLAEIRPHKQGFVARLQGIEDRTAAEGLKGHWLGVTEDKLPIPADNEYYWRDLIGAAVVDQHGADLGLVADLIATGAHDVLVVNRGSDANELLIPFHRQYVLGVDLAAARIRVDWADSAGSE